jgi:Tfp pilus assembly protein PilN
VRAVNLIPGDQRGGQSVGAGRSGGAAYAVLGLIVAIALMALLYGKARRDVSSKQGQIATLTAQAQQAEAQSDALAPYTSFVALREQRASAVADLVDSRFDWAHAFHEFGRVLSAQTSITSLSGSISTPAPAASAPAPTTTTSASTSVSSSTPPGSVPSFSLSGCATSQDTVALMLQDLRLIDGVSEVTLQSSAKSASSGASGPKGAAVSSSAGGCQAGDPVFSVTVTFDPLPSTSETAAAVKTAEKTTVSDKNATGGAQG